ncbi:helix-turn-helix transcriptional regulator [Clostridioides sp. ES-S-0049-02]|uniref:helix-turn-helix domain-containing protein n=1 Tax=Clostridioides sp. ES-S-0049-02 TaxID=2770778 RepID=UPI001D113E76|nr:helix-turn-helix transcriptional regulator [Clostridioides sp. ES-S-0049-02]
MKLEKLINIRKEKKYSQEDIARMLDISLRNYHRKEKGENQFTISEFEKIYKFLNINPLELLD